MSSTVSYASSKQDRPLTNDERLALCAKAVSELRAARELLADMEARLDTARAEIKAAGEKGELLAATVANLELQVEGQKKLVANLEEQVKVLTADNERVRAERDRANKRNLLWAIGGVALGALIVAAVSGGNP